ncbi:MAG: ABC transporter ATP-binding protein/permease [Acholeplasmatales bacterium]|nr:ABC transporter ATP-binding protein/permease [Acholeplasmatales bacterium]
MQNNERKMKRGEILSRLFKYTSKYKGQYILALFFGFLAVICELIGPLMLSKVVDELTDGSITIKYIIEMTTIYLVVSVFISQLFLFIERWMLVHIGQKIVYSIREDIFIHVLSLSHKEFTSIPTGKLVTRITSDTLTLNEMFTKTLVNMIRDLITALVAIVIMVIVSAKMSLYILAFTPLLLVITYFFARFSKNMYRHVRNAQTDMNTFLSESINGIRVIKAYSVEDKERKVFKEKNRRVLKTNILQMSVFAVFRPIIYSIYLVSVLVILYFGGRDAIAGGISAAVIVAFYSYISYYYDPIVDLAELLNTFEDSLSSCEKIFVLLDIKPTIVNCGSKTLPSFSGKIEFRHVYFKYNKDSRYILEDVSFIINPGETIALVGPTGGGKSTIINLIERNYDIEKGEIFIDDINILDLDLNELRRNIGMMLQDVHLFSGSIMDNIRLFDDTITDNMCIEASKKVSAYDMIEGLSDGFNTTIYENGMNLSQGQRQLISFTRAMAANPSMMILDEATANIDTKTEALIQEGILELEKGRTMIIVAHRLSTIKHASRIFVVNNGRIVEEGSHNDLMRVKGLYYNLYLSQYKD